jgi:hypothetical protein
MDIRNPGAKLAEAGYTEVFRPTAETAEAP